MPRCDPTSHGSSIADSQRHRRAPTGALSSHQGARFNFRSPLSPTMTRWTRSGSSASWPRASTALSSGHTAARSRTRGTRRGWKDLRRLLRLWSLRAVAVSQPGFYESRDAARAAPGGGMLLDDAIRQSREAR